MIALRSNDLSTLENSQNLFHVILGNLTLKRLRASGNWDMTGKSKNN